MVDPNTPNESRPYNNHMGEEERENMSYVRGQKTIKHHILSLSAKI